MPEPTHDADQPRGRLVLITGTGRSGTSTASGTLSHLGLHVPGPYLGANRSNPKGFFESRWAVRFHKRLHKRAWINDFDGRPEAVELAREAITPAMRDELRGFLEDVSGEHDQVVVKDPRTVWCQALWADCSADVGLSIRYLSMLRHPAEVLGSRTEYYAAGADDDRRRYYATSSLGRWINSSIVNERETRGARRTFVRYVDLLRDWRTTMKKVAVDLGLEYDSDLDDMSPHPVDEFIDPDLRRVQVTWDDVDVPAPLRELAEEVWQNLEALADSDGTDEGASRTLDGLGARYAAMVQDAKAMSHDATEQSVNKAKDTAVRQERKRVREEEAAAAEAADPAAEQSGVDRFRARARGALGAVASKVRSK
ncbi:sulfotransferase family protein [Solicola gregarius]|uniref:Sulfotransferase family protein n=1 Tax=Solicola gregarius TaxID=2908642 RepID=A0AA46TGJ0_9ACTN|nr:sulfotransferase family protein [Solicola gregarius]UYM04855.1 sulfotransferase family protein [Solicola gregarius]